MRAQPLALVILSIGAPLATIAAIENTRYGTILGALTVMAAWLVSLDGWRRLYAVTLVLMVFGASSQSELVTGAFYLRYAAAAALAWLTCTATFGVPTRMASRLAAGMWTLVFIALASVMWSITRGTTLQQAVALLILASLIYGLVRGRWLTRPALIVGDFSVAYTVLVGSFLLSLVASSAGLPNTHTFDGRLQGIYSNPNTLGDLIGLAIPLGVALYIDTRRSIYLVGLLPCVLALAQCQTRTAIIAAGVGLVWLMLRRGLAVTVKTLAIVAVAGAGIWELARKFNVAPSLFDGIRDRFQTGDASGNAFNSRTVAWHDALTLWAHKPLQGYGFQAGDALFRTLYANGIIQFGSAPTHNSYLQALLEMGILGAVPIAVILFGVVLPAVFRADRRHLGSPFVGVVVAGLAVQFTESSMFGTGQPYPWIFWLSVAAVACAVRSDRGDDRDATGAVTAGPARLAVDGRTATTATGTVEPAVPTSATRH